MNEKKQLSEKTYSTTVFVFSILIIVRDNYLAAGQFWSECPLTNETYEL